MSFLQKLFSAKKSEPVAPITPEEIAAVRQLLGEKKDAEVVEQGEALLQRAPNETIQQMVGLAYFQQKQTEKAVEYLRPLAANSQNAAHWFNYATAAIVNNQIDDGMNAFITMLEFYTGEGTDEEMPPYGMLRYFMLRALLDVQAPQDAVFFIVDRLKMGFCSLNTTDDHFLYSHGMPFFHDVMNRSLHVLLAMDKAVVLPWLDEFSEGVDDAGKQVLLRIREVLEQETPVD